MKRIAYIPARAGSKRIPGKNIKCIDGVPLIAYTIRAAQQSNLFEKIFVSTDSEEIAAIARRYGADVPFLRCAEVAQDTTRTIDTVCSDVTRMKALGWSFDVFVLLQPTSPLRQSDDIRGAVQLFESKGLDCGGVITIVPVTEHPVFMRLMNEDARLENVLPCSSTVRSQDLPAYYRINGAVYVNSWNELSPDLSLNDNRYGYVIGGGGRYRH